MKPSADLTRALVREVGGAPVRLSLSGCCFVAAAVFAYVQEVSADCTDTVTNAGAGGGSACVLARASYGGPAITSSPVVSNDSGPPAITSLTFTAPDLTIISGGSAGRAIRADGGNITFEGNVTVYRESGNGPFQGATNNNGWGLEAHGRTPERGSVVIFKKDATFSITVLNGDAVEVSNGSITSFLGFTDITAGRFGLHSLAESGRISYAPGSSLIELNDLRVRSGDEALKVNGALNNTIVVTGSVVDIETSGANGRGIQAEDGGKAFVRGSGGVGSADGNSLIVLDTATATVSTGGASAHGLHAVSKVGDATIELGGGAVTTLGKDAEGIYAYVNGGTGNAYVTITGGSVTTVGEDADGVLAVVYDDDLISSIPGHATVLMTGGSISVSGDASAGLLAQTDIGLVSSLGNASVTQSGGTVLTRGDTLPGSNILNIPQGSYALSALALGSGNAEVIQTAGSAKTEGQGAHAIYTFTNSGNNTINQGAGASAIATGADSSGLRAVALVGGTNTLTFNGTLTGGSGLAAALHSLSRTSSVISIGATAKIDGSASGIAIRDGDSDLDGSDDFGGDAQISIGGHVIGDVIMGLGDDSILLSAGILDGDIYGDDQLESANDGNDSFTWTGGTWLSSFFGGGGSDTVIISASSYDGTHHVLDGGDDTASADGFIDRLTFQNISAAADGANLRNWEVITLDEASISITDGSVQVGADADTGMFLRNTSVLNAGTGLVLDGNLTIDASSAFVSAGAGGGLYSVTGDVTQAGHLSLSDGVAGDRFSTQSNYQANGGLVVLDTQLGADDSVTDRLILLGDSQGSAQLQVNNAAGLGAQTVEGIKVVEVLGNSAVQFTLTGDYLFEGQPTVVGGAYAYRLYKDGAIATGDEGWYLRSVLDDSQTPDPEPKPHYNPGVPLYESYGQHLLGLTTLPTLQQRIAGRTFTQLAVAKRESENALFVPEREGFWGRIDGGHTAYKPARSSSGLNFDLDLWRMQGGVDRILSDSGRGILVGGLTAHYSQGFSDVSSVHGHGKLSSSGAGLGGTLTWYTPNDLYVDLQGQVTWLGSKINSKTAQRKLAGDNHAYAYSFSLETGKQLALTEQLSWTPQAQLVHTNVRIDNFTDPFGAKVESHQAKSTRARVGVSLDRYWASGDKKAHVYTIANVYREFAEPSSVNVSGTSFDIRSERGWGELGLGGSFSWDEKYQLYTELSYASALSQSNGNHAALGTVGLKINW